MSIRFGGLGTMMFVVLIIFALAIFVLPNLWAKWVLKRHTRGRDDYPGTGAELADHLLRRLGIEGASVERTEFGDHYDPETRCVRLSPDNYDGRSLTAVTVAAHEVGHAIQHHQGYAPLLARSRLVKVAQKAEKLGAILMMAAPFLFLLNLGEFAFVDCTCHSPTSKSLELSLGHSGVYSDKTTSRARASIEMME